MDIMSRKELEEIKGELVRRFVDGLGDNLVALAFFGSWARGEAGEHSDIDLLLIARELPANPIERGKVVYKPIRDMEGQGRISILARTVEEFTADVTPLHLDLSEDAIVIHDPEGFLESRLRRVRELIEEAGLERRRDSKGLLYWWWKGPPPKPGWSLTWEGFKGWFPKRMPASG